MKTLVQKLWWHKRKVLFAVVTSVLLVLALNQWVVRSVDQRVYADLAKLPQNDVCLVLGTGKYLASGNLNLHFQARMDAAARLYREGKVKHLLLSGDNHRVGYDEPTDMKESLMARGVPAEAMTLDYAGFRTLDSVVRAREIFGCGKLTIVTDDFHAHRAVFLAENKGIKAIAFTSAKVQVNLSLRSRVREVAARVKAVADLYVLHTKPKFLGDKIEIQVENQKRTQRHFNT